MSINNKAILIGNVGRDPEVTHFENGSVVANFPLATSDTYKDKEGGLVTKTEWHNIVVWGKLAKVIEDHVIKGSHLAVSGKIQTRTYEDNLHIKRYRTEVNISEMQMIGGKKVAQASSETDIDEIFPEERK